MSSVQVWGEKELRIHEKLSTAAQKSFWREKMDLRVTVIILTGGHVFPASVIEEARRAKIALFTSPFSLKKCRDLVKETRNASGRKIIPGGLLEIFDMGVLIVGDSGVGKSESALDLVSRGYGFVSDDVTECWISGGRLMGAAPEISRHFMEVRGLGIINIQEIFGPQAICPEIEISLVIKLQRWKEGKEYDRIKLKFPRAFNIFGVMLPQLRIPVAPGRNISNLIEVACRVHALKEKGYHAPEEIVKRLDKALAAQAGGKKESH